ncbi:unnamed protein product [Amoebophrya sp. A120]|nr:unnamed protein product [Amoebophrya sp. A120]|eukprot:GSA120T00002458001.1
MEKTPSRSAASPCPKASPRDREASSFAASPRPVPRRSASSASIKTGAVVPQLKLSSVSEKIRDNESETESQFAHDEFDQSLLQRLEERNSAALEASKALAYLESCNKALHQSAKQFNKRNSCTKQDLRGGLETETQDCSEDEEDQHDDLYNTDAQSNASPVRQPRAGGTQHVPEWRDVWSTSISDIGRYGVGCQLYFDFLKWLILILGGMAIFSSPLMYTCLHGTMVSSPFGALARTTIGNLGALPPDLSAASSKEEQIEMLRNRKLMLGDREFSMHKFTTFFGLLDGSMILVFFLWSFWYRKKQLIATVETHDVANTTPNDYAVHIANLPSAIWKNGVRLSLDEYESLLKEHIEGVLRANVQRYRAEKHGELVRRKKRELLLDLREQHNAKLEQEQEMNAAATSGSAGTSTLKTRISRTVTQTLRGGGPGTTAAAVGSQRGKTAFGSSGGVEHTERASTKSSAASAAAPPAVRPSLLARGVSGSSSNLAEKKAQQTAFYYDGGEVAKPSEEENTEASSSGLVDEDDEEDEPTVASDGVLGFLYKTAARRVRQAFASVSGVEAANYGKRRRKSSLDSVSRSIRRYLKMGSSSTNNTLMDVDPTDNALDINPHRPQPAADAPAGQIVLAGGSLRNSKGTSSSREQLDVALAAPGGTVSRSRQSSKESCANIEVDLDSENNWQPVPELQLGEFVLCCRDHGAMYALDERILLGKKRRRLQYEIQERKMELTSIENICKPRMLTATNSTTSSGESKRNSNPNSASKFSLGRGGQEEEGAGGEDVDEDQRLHALQRELQQLERHIKRVATRLRKRIVSRKENEVVRAFVIFDNCLDKEIFLWSYRYGVHTDKKELLGKVAGNSEFLRSLFGYDVRESPLAFEGKLLKVTPAPEPSNILWENVDGLPDNFFKAFPRKYGATMAAALLLFVSFVLVFFCEVLPEVGWSDVDAFTIGAENLLDPLPLLRADEGFSPAPSHEFFARGGIEYELTMEVNVPLQFVVTEPFPVPALPNAETTTTSTSSVLPAVLATTVAAPAWLPSWSTSDELAGVTVEPALSRAKVVREAESHFLQNFLGENSLFTGLGKTLFPWLFVHPVGAAGEAVTRPPYLEGDASSSSGVSSATGNSHTTSRSSGVAASAADSGSSARLVAASDLRLRQGVHCSSLQLYLGHLFSATQFFQGRPREDPVVAESSRRATIAEVELRQSTPEEQEQAEAAADGERNAPFFYSANLTSLLQEEFELTSSEAVAWSTASLPCSNRTVSELFQSCLASLHAAVPDQQCAHLSWSYESLRRNQFPLIEQTSVSTFSQNSIAADNSNSEARVEVATFPLIRREIRARFRHRAGNNQQIVGFGASSPPSSDHGDNADPIAVRLLSSPVNITGVSVCDGEESCAPVRLAVVKDLASLRTSAMPEDASAQNETAAATPEDASAGGTVVEQSTTAYQPPTFADQAKFYTIPTFDCDTDGATLELSDVLLWNRLGSRLRDGLLRAENHDLTGVDHSSRAPYAERVVGCFCGQQSYMTIASNQRVRSLCHAHMLRLLRQTLGFVFGSFIVVGMNVVLEHCLNAMSMWARPLSITALNNALMWKLFLMEFVNTAIVILLVNTRFDYNGPLLGKGDYTDFEFDWYADVGVGIVVTMMINVFSPHVGTVLKGYLRKKRRKRLLRSKVKIAEDMTELYLGAQFELATRYSTILTVVFVTLMYSAAIPLLLWMATLTFTLLFWCDKWTLLRTSRIPPAHDETIAKGVAEALPFAVLLHIFLAIYMYGHDLVFPSPSFAPDDEQLAAAGFSTSAGGRGAADDQDDDAAPYADYQASLRFFRAATFFLFLVLVFVLVVMALERFAILLHALVEKFRAAYHPLLRDAHPNLKRRLDAVVEVVLRLLTFLIGDSAEDDLTEGRYTEQVEGMKKQRFLHTYRPEANLSYARRFQMLDRLREGRGASAATRLSARSSRESAAGPQEGGSPGNIFTVQKGADDETDEACIADLHKRRSRKLSRSGTSHVDEEDDDEQTRGTDRKKKKKKEKEAAKRIIRVPEMGICIEFKEEP